MSFEKPIPLEQDNQIAELEFVNSSQWRLKYGGKEIFESKNERIGKCLYLAMTMQNRVSKERQKYPFGRPVSGTSGPQPRKNFADFLSDTVDCDIFVRLAFEAAEPFDIDWDGGWNHSPDIRFFQKKERRVFETSDNLVTHARANLSVGEIGVMEVTPTAREEKKPFDLGTHVTLVLHGNDGEVYVLHKKGMREFKIEPLRNAFNTFRRDYGSTFAVKGEKRVLKLVRRQMKQMKKLED